MTQFNSSQSQTPQLTRESLDRAVLEAMKKPLDQITEEEAFEFIPLRDQTLPEWKRMGYWGKLAHEMMEQNQLRMLAISRRSPTAYEELLGMIDREYPNQEYDLLAQWQELNPIQEGENRKAWMLQGRMSAREILTSKLAQELGVS